MGVYLRNNKKRAHGNYYEDNFKETCLQATTYK